MAPLDRNVTPAKRRAGLPSLATLLVLLAGGGLLQGAGANTCEEQDVACLNSETCNSCTLGFERGTECAEFEFDDSENACPHGVSYCCAAKTAGLETCLNDPITQEYLECNLEALGCSVFDMPCFQSSAESAVGEAETRTSSSGNPTTATDVLSSAAPPRGAFAVRTAAAAAAVALAVSFAARSNGDSLLAV